MDKVYCPICDQDRDIIIQEENVQMEIKGHKFSFIGDLSYCTSCGEEVYIPELNDENVRKANGKFREIKGIIKISEINELVSKYSIGKEPLAILLGWGEKTILRYCNGMMPLIEYSDKLKELSNPHKMRELFDRNRDRLTPIAQKKTDQAIKDVIELSVYGNQISKIINVSKYFLKHVDVESGDFITPLKLQKLLYYAQAWMLAYFKVPLFEADFQAWIHGPVEPHLYFHYQEYGYDPIPKVENFDDGIFNENEKMVLQEVWQVYGKYGAKFLERLTHSEEPWRKARGACRANEKSNVVIGKESMMSYYSSIKEEKAKSLNDLDDYVKNIRLVV